MGEIFNEVLEFFLLSFYISANMFYKGKWQTFDLKWSRKQDFWTIASHSIIKSKPTFGVKARNRFIYSFATRYLHIYFEFTLTSRSVHRVYITLGAGSQSSCIDSIFITPDRRSEWGSPLKHLLLTHLIILYINNERTDNFSGGQEHCITEYIWASCDCLTTFMCCKGCGSETCCCPQTIGY